jgi:hypothetical protein
MSQHKPSLTTLTGRAKASLVLLLLLWCCAVTAQTPVANRIKAMTEALPKSAVVVAKYTDNARHCLYYILHNRLFCYDVLTDKSKEVNLVSSSYMRIITSWLSPDGNFFFVAVDRGSFAKFYLDDGQELWRYDSFTHRPLKVGQGFSIERQKGCFIIKRASRCLNPQAAQSRQHWMAQDHYYDLYGKNIWAKDEYQVR